jgi:hypothetical protein
MTWEVCSTRHKKYTLLSHGLSMASIAGHGDGYRAQVVHSQRDSARFRAKKEAISWASSGELALRELARAGREPGFGARAGGSSAASRLVHGVGFGRITCSPQSPCQQAAGEAGVAGSQS